MFFLGDDAVDAAGPANSGRLAGAGSTWRKGRALEMFVCSGMMNCP